MPTEYDIVIVWDTLLEIDVDYYEIWRVAFTDVLTIDDVNEAEGRFDLPAALGDITASIPDGSQFEVFSSTGNNGLYIVDHTDFVGGKTRIFVTVTPLPDPTADGYIRFWSLSGKTKNTVYVDRDIPVGSYYYKVRAVDKMGNEGDFTGIITKTSPPDTTAPSTPTGFTARRLDNLSGVKLAWNVNTEEDIRGYILWRTYDGVDWHIAAKTNRNEYKDDDMPRSDDEHYRCTFVAYALAAYDKYNNTSVSTAATDIFIIPLIQSIYVTVDYLSLNVYWRRPLPEDNVQLVKVWYKKSVDSAWTYGGEVNYPLSSVRINGPLLKNTAYDILIDVYPRVWDIKKTETGIGLDYFVITDNVVGEFGIGDTITVQNNPNAGNYTVAGRTYNAGPNETILSVNEPMTIDTGPVGELFNVTDPAVSGAGTAIVPQNPIVTILVPDYTEDTTPPTAPVNALSLADPENKRIFISWAQKEINDDFLYFAVYVWNTGLSAYELYDKTTRNTATINRADLYAFTLSVPYEYIVRWYVVAVDRSGNASTAASDDCLWHSPDYFASNNLPQWGTYTERDLTTYKPYPIVSASQQPRQYELTWNDCGRTSPFFRRYVLYLWSLPSIFPIINVDTTNEWFEIAGDYRYLFPNPSTFIVYGSTGNNGSWVSGATALVAGNSRLFVMGNITDATVDGYVLIPWQTVLNQLTTKLAANESLLILAHTTYANLNVDLPQVTGVGQYIMPAVQDWFGDTYLGTTDSIIAILST